MSIASLWVFEVIKFDPNAWISMWQHRRRQKKGIASVLDPKPKETTLIGAFLFGSSSGFIASPCTTPALTVSLSFIATQKSVAFGAVLMMAFALGLGTLLVFIGTFTGALKLLPKSGRWLGAVKIASGASMLALAMYFVFKAGTLA
jgi:cytochrome c biogenesis protein CcdA